MRAAMASDIFYWHGYTAVHLAGRWVKATPAFNIELCEKFGFLPLEFDGRNDSLYHPFEREGNKHLEYLTDRGEFADTPIDAMIATFRERYSRPLAEGMQGSSSSDFETEVEAEIAKSG
jgi:hypothetical protein